MKFVIAACLAASSVFGFPRFFRESSPASYFADASDASDPLLNQDNFEQQGSSPAPMIEYPAQPGWKAAQPGEVRSPCPMLNSLANHEILPRSGQRITREILNEALTGYLKLDAGVANFLATQALDGVGYDDAGVRYFDLDGLQRCVFFYIAFDKDIAQYKKKTQHHRA